MKGTKKKSKVIEPVDNILRLRKAAEEMRVEMGLDATTPLEGMDEAALHDEIKLCITDIRDGDKFSPETDAVIAEHKTAPAESALAVEAPPEETPAEKAGPVVVKGLSPVELTDLDKHEAVIKAGLHTFADVGHALLAIRDGKLYREQHATFEAYCQERWQWSRQHAYQLIAAAGVDENLSSMLDKPQNTRQAAPLAKLPAEQQAPAWEAAKKTAKAKGKPVTARDVKDEVERRTGKPPVKQTTDWQRFTDFVEVIKETTKELAALNVDAEHKAAAKKILRAIGAALEKLGA